MTDHQKILIDQMRRNGSGYIKIAKAIGVSENTVKSYCRRQKNAAVKEKMPVCDECSRPIDISKRKNRRFCSDTCRMKWWNKHPNTNMSYMAHCACCDKEIRMRRKGERKYCSHRCYIAFRYRNGGSNG
jgi:uncharacterized protein YjcR